ncbi:MAG TPA: serine protease [Pyrinomonadaceae bacterium]
MKKEICALVILILAAPLLAPVRAADDPVVVDPLAAVLKREGYTVSLDLKVRKKKRDALQHFFEMLDGEVTPNAYATGFVVGEGLVMTAYHAVSGGLDVAHRKRLGFSADEGLEVSAFVNGCEATVLMVDREADLALLRVCRAKRLATAHSFQDAPGPDDELLVIARPNGIKAVRRGPFSGTYTYRGRQYWAAKIEGRDGFSGSPVYNGKGEIVGVFTGYDSTLKVALISPGPSVQKLLAEYSSGSKP